MSDPRDPRPHNCRHRLQDEGKAYPRSACEACGRTVTTGLGNRCYLERNEPADEADTHALGPALERVLEAVKDRATPRGDSDARDVWDWIITLNRLRSLRVELSTDARDTEGTKVMGEHFNQLTPAAAERLAMLAEEAAEVVQIVGKILRHGYASTHPDNPQGPDNREMLHKELTDLEAVRRFMRLAGELPAMELAEIDRSCRQKLRFARHQVTKGVD